MEKNQLTKLEISISFHLLPDILKVITGAQMDNRVLKVNERKGMVEMEIHYQGELNYHRKAIAELEEMLEEYDAIRYETGDDSDWRDHTDN
jgi:hypothetical protein